MTDHLDEAPSESDADGEEAGPLRSADRGRPSARIPQPDVIAGVFGD